MRFHFECSPPQVFSFQMPGASELVINFDNISIANGCVSVLRNGELLENFDKTIQESP